MLAHDSGFSTMMRSWARMQAAHGRAPVYAYVFERRHPYTPGVAFSDLDPATAAVNHTDDLPYWLDTFDSLNGPRRTRNWTAADYLLGGRMQAAIVAFAATGNPNTPALGLSWPRYDPKGEKMIAFGDGVRLRAWPNRALMDRLAAIGIPDPRTAKEERK
ncbi:hypothetical protein ASE70_03990 [Sphingomonas sp. Leaf22]|uniref:carboxylesterase family protein n=1 Tax=Sphingomonas sp. Leaf22 TaxID=1735687 RepID=UPI0006FEAABC|nr:carboxylesterase family protein [Sphingomonas sp. Leaf22]KQM84734.1 hypothetical protein ASE70_03990 [Sphingomonas sp. Leaf22]